MEVRDIVRRTEDAIRLQPFESVYVYDQNAILLFKKDGTQFEVEITPAEMKLLKNAIVTHNHPRGLRYPDSDPRSAGSPFALNDLRVAAAGGIAEMRVVTPKLRFLVRPPARGWPSVEEVERVYREADASVKLRFFAEVAAGRLTPEQAQARHYHEVMLVVAPELGLHYALENS